MRWEHYFLVTPPVRSVASRSLFLSTLSPSQASKQIRTGQSWSDFAGFVGLQRTWRRQMTCNGLASLNSTFRSNRTLFPPPQVSLGSLFFFFSLETGVQASYSDSSSLLLMLDLIFRGCFSLLSFGFFIFPGIHLPREREPKKKHHVYLNNLLTSSFFAIEETGEYSNHVLHCLQLYVYRAFEWIENTWMTREADI
jgi:hypothetical protein